MADDFDSGKYKKDNITFAVVAEEHQREAERLKKAWFDHVLLSLERLSDNVSKLSAELYTAQDNLFKDIVSTKEGLRKEVAKAKSEVGVDLEKLERRIERSIDQLNKSIDSISVQGVKDELKNRLDDLKALHNKDMQEIRNENLPLRDSVTRLRVKVAIWGVLGGIIGAAILTGFFSWIFPLIKL